jgi:mRNA-degrading endonuclease RelE of RelBE toxin-antitoxin system
VRYEVRLSDRAAKDLDRLNRKTQLRMLNRLDQIAEAPHDPRFSGVLTNQGGLRKSRVGA